MKFKTEPGPVIAKSYFKADDGTVYQTVTIAQQGYALKVPLTDRQFDECPEPESEEMVEVSGICMLIEKPGKGIKPIYSRLRLSFEDSARAARPSLKAAA